MNLFICINKSFKWHSVSVFAVCTDHIWTIKVSVNTLSSILTVFKNFLSLLVIIIFKESRWTIYRKSFLVESSETLGNISSGSWTKGKSLSIWFSTFYIWAWADPVVSWRNFFVVVYKIVRMLFWDSSKLLFPYPPYYLNILFAMKLLISTLGWHQKSILLQMFVLTISRTSITSPLKKTSGFVYLH